MLASWGGTHEPCLGNVARRAAIFSDAMCEVIFSGFSAQMKAENECGINHVMLEGSDEVNACFKNLAIERGGAKASSLVFAALQRGTMPGEVTGGQEVLQRGTARLERRGITRHV